jgi:hypothetical protein
MDATYVPQGDTHPRQRRTGLWAYGCCPHCTNASRSCPTKSPDRDVPPSEDENLGRAKHLNSYRSVDERMSMRSSYSWRLGMLVELLPIQPATRDRSSDVVRFPPPTLWMAVEARSTASFGSDSITSAWDARNSASAI